MLFLVCSTDLALLNAQYVYGCDVCQADSSSWALPSQQQSSGPCIPLEVSRNTVEQGLWQPFCRFAHSWFQLLARSRLTCEWDFHWYNYKLTCSRWNTSWTIISMYWLLTPIVGADSQSGFHSRVPSWAIRGSASGAKGAGISILLFPFSPLTISTCRRSLATVCMSFWLSRHQHMCFASGRSSTHLKLGVFFLWNHCHCVFWRVKCCLLLLNDRLLLCLLCFQLGHPVLHLFKDSDLRAPAGCWHHVRYGLPIIGHSALVVALGLRVSVWRRDSLWHSGIWWENASRVWGSRTKCAESIHHGGTLLKSATDYRWNAVSWLTCRCWAGADAWNIWNWFTPMGT